MTFRRKEYFSIPRVRVSVLLEDTESKFNIGSILRIADGFMLEKVFLAGPPKDLSSYKIKKTAIGSERWVPVAWIDSALDLIARKKGEGYEILAAELSPGSIPYQTYHRDSRPVLLVLGNEARGVTPEALALADRILEIPVGGMIRSLNVSTAGAILIAHLVGNEAHEIKERYC